MAAMRAPTPIEAARAVLRRRGESQRVVVRLDDALAGSLEGIAFAGEVVASINRIGMAAAAGSVEAVINEANRLGHRTIRFRDECRRIAGTLDGGDAA